MTGELVPPKATMAGSSDTESRWYQVQARGSGRVEMFIYGEIGAFGISAQQFVRDCQAAGVFEASALDLRIHSPGGNVIDGLAIYNTLARLRAKVDIWVDGMAASMASMLVCLPNATVHIPENAWLMIHRCWGGMSGEADDLRSYADFLERNEAMILGAYTAKSGLSSDELKSMMAAETWMTGAEAVEFGFADVLAPAIEAAASLCSNRFKDFKNMPSAVNGLFGSQANTSVPPAANGLPPVPGTTQPPAPRDLPAPNAASAGDNANIPQAVAAAMVQFQQANAARITSVRAVFEHFPAFAQLRESCVNDMSVSPEVARDRLLQAMADQAVPHGAGGGYGGYVGNGNLVGDSIRAAVMHRAGHAEAEADNRYTGYTLRELARASLTDRGIGLSGAQLPMQMVALAFTHSSSDFGAILMDVAHKSALQGWEGAPETFERWTLKGTLTDFKTSHRVGLEAFPNLREVRPGAEYKYVTLKDRGEPIALATYGELFSIDRHTIVNDDMAALTRIPMSMGAAARSTIGDLVYAVLTSNPTMSDGQQLFSDAHGNIVNAALDINGMDLARQAMLLQKSGDRRLNIRPAFMLTPVAIESKARQMVTSISVPGADMNAGISNPLHNFVEVIGEPRLDDSSVTDWYLAAAQGRDTIEVAYLDGMDAPYLEQQNGFTVDGAAFKVRIDAGVAALDSRGLVKASAPAGKK